MNYHLIKIQKITSIILAIILSIFLISPIFLVVLFVIIEISLQALEFIIFLLNGGLKFLIIDSL